MSSGVMGVQDANERPAPPSDTESWLKAILAALHEAVLVLDPEGVVLEMNSAFTELFGYSAADAPIVAPYPWWPTPTEDPEQLPFITGWHAAALQGETGVSEFRFFTRARRSVWVSCATAHITGPDGHIAAVVRSFRDITKEKEAQIRRAAAARLSADLAHADDLASLLSLGEHGFETLFDGGSTTQVDIDERYLFSGGQRITPDELSDGARIGLAGTISADAMSLRRGILLVPQTSSTGCRVWVEFPQPRRIGPDEMIVADLLAQAFGLALDRFLDAQQAADREANLRQAMNAQRTIGQAVGILVERYRITAGQAFDRLKQASQNRNIKLRELATRIIETGSEPEEA